VLFCKSRTGWVTTRIGTLPVDGFAWPEAAEVSAFADLGGPTVWTPGGLPRNAAFEKSHEAAMLFDAADTKTENIYKLLTSTIGPRPIAWVTTQDVDGTVNAAPFSFFNAMSGNPPVLAFGIGGRGPGDVKDTGGNIRRTGQYVINLVSYELAEPMNVTAIDFPKEIDELKEAGLTTAPSLRVKPPRIAEAPVSFECERLVIVDVGIDRAVVLGKVLAIHVRDDCVLDRDRCHIDTPKLDLIGRLHGSGWYARVTDRFELPRIPLDEWPARKARAAE
jgi:flavin reductase (DIM6/NTAB) family NADH-FMN oxidoreductase RutF